MTITSEQVAAMIVPDSNIFIQTAAAAPQALIKAMTARAHELRNITIYQMHTEGAAPYAAPGMELAFNINCFFIGANLRRAVQEGRAQYIPVFISEIPALFRKGIIAIDYAFIHVSPPDKHGYCSLGVSVDIAPAVLDTAKYIIAQVNQKMPRTHGGGFIHTSRIHAMVMNDDEIFESHPGTAGSVTTRIAEQVATLIEDGATLQMGIGNIPDAVLKMLGGHRRLGVHSEMFSDGIINLIEDGVITGEKKKKHPGKVVGSFILGTKQLYNYVSDNPLFEILESGYINNPLVIAQNPRVTAINSAIEIDLTGQVCADSIGSKMYSGVGGQMDFIFGAALSEGGKPVIAMPSVTEHGESKIVNMLKPGAGVVTTRSHVQYIVTEYGIANLIGKNLKERALALIKIAHPAHQERLTEQAWTLVKHASPILL